jgi:hypothetical protein
MVSNLGAIADVGCQMGELRSLLFGEICAYSRWRPNLTRSLAMDAEPGNTATTQT